MGAVRDAVRACGGTISIDTEDGRGTTFTFRFPASMLEPDDAEIVERLAS